MNSFSDTGNSPDVARVIQSKEPVILYNGRPMPLPMYCKSPDGKVNEKNLKLFLEALNSGPKIHEIIYGTDNRSLVKTKKVKYIFGIPKSRLIDILNLINYIFFIAVGYKTARFVDRFY